MMIKCSKYAKQGVRVLVRIHRPWSSLLNKPFPIAFETKHALPISFRILIAFVYKKCGNGFFCVYFLQIFFQVFFI